MVRQQRKRIGEVLSEMGLVTPEQLTQALERQQRTGERLGRALVAVGVSEDQIAHGLSQQLELPMMDFRHQDIDPAAVALLPESLARKYSVLPIRREGTRLMLAMSDPLDVVALDDVAIATGMIVAPVVTTETEIASAIEISYGMGDRAKGLLEEIAARPGAISEAEEDDDVGSALERTDAPVIRLADLIVHARDARPGERHPHRAAWRRSVRVRYRIDGILQTVMTIPRNASVPLIARFKVLARMNVAERRAPQDGSFQMAGNGKTVDVRDVLDPDGARRARGAAAPRQSRYDSVARADRHGARPARALRAVDPAAAGASSSSRARPAAAKRRRSSAASRS